MPDASSFSAMVCLGLVPSLALRLDPQAPRLLKGMGLVLGLGAATAALVPRGPLSAAIAALFLVFALWNLAWSVGRYVSTPRALGPVPWAAAVGGVGPLVAGIAWVGARWRGSFAGFPEPLASLTVPHFTVTFWLLPMALAAWTHGLARARGKGRRAAGLWGVALLPAATGTLFALRASPMVPSLGEVALTWALVGALGLWWQGIRAAPQVAAGLGGRPVRAAALVLTVGTAFGALYATSMATGLPWLGIGGMLATHGIANLLAVVVLAAFAPSLPDLPAGAPAPDPALATVPGNPTLAVLVDRKRIPLGPDHPAAWGALRARILRGTVYPLHVMERRAAFLDEGRPARVGEVIAMGLRLPTLPGLPPAVLPAQVRVHIAEETDDSVTFGYSTTTEHYGCGQWQVRLVRDGDTLVMEMESHLRPVRWFLWPGIPVYRRVQQAAVASAAAGLRAELLGSLPQEE